MYPTVEKQSLSLAPDLMQHRPPRYEHPQPDTRAEHHYDVPHLTNRFVTIEDKIIPLSKKKLGANYVFEVIIEQKFQNIFFYIHIFL